MTVVLAVDPGRRKCGLAVVCSEQGVLLRRVVPRDALVESVREVVEAFVPGEVLVGGSTGSREALGELSAALPRPPQVVDERFTTERARRRYFVDHPPRGLWRLVPLGLQVPPDPVDDYAAVVMAEDWLSRESGGAPPGPH